MSVVIGPGTCQFTLNYALSGSASGNAATVLGFGQQGGDPLDPNVFAEFIVNEWATHLAPQTSFLVRLTSVYWATATASGVVNANEVGERVGDMELPNTAFLASYYTGLKGPRGRGRSYWPGLVNSSDTGDAAIIDGNRMAAITTALDGFFDALVDPPITGAPQIILQRDEPDQKSPPISPAPIVIRRVYSNRPATQRRRLRR